MAKSAGPGRLPPNSKASQAYDAAIASYRAGKLDEGLRHVETAIAANPAFGADWNLKGVLFNNLQRFADAVQALTQAAKLMPASAAPYTNRAKSRLGLTDAEGAAEDARKAISLEPNNADAMLHLVNALEMRGQTQEALGVIDRAVALAPKSANVFITKAQILNKLGRPEDSLAQIENAIACAPNDHGLKLNRCSLLLRLGRTQEALAGAEDILRAQPQNAAALRFMGDYHFNYREDRHTANDFYRKSLAARFDQHVAASLVFSLINTRGPDEPKFIEEAQTIAAACLDQFGFNVQTAKSFSSAFDRTCDFARLAKIDFKRCAEYWAVNDVPGGLHGLLSHTRTRPDRLELLAEHKRWGDIVQQRLNPPPLPNPARAPRSKVRIGIMSSDLRDHPVAYFALPIFQHFDRERVEVYAYSFNPREADNVQRFITERATVFRTILGGTDRAAAEQIGADDLDIVFELGGSTHLSRPKILSHRVAPLQASWLGYPHSLGLPTIDYLLVDPYLKPSADLMLEKPFEMPSSWVCVGPVGFHDRAMPADAPPVDARGFITFGTANNPMKYTPELLGLWARTMNAVPGSRFVFVRPEGAVQSFRQNVCGVFAAHGVAAERIEFRPVRGQHLPHYGAMDISLDCVPHTGGTTTCESLWMGVPCVTRIGESFFERISYSNLSNAGLGDLCAQDDDDYVRIAAALAADVPRLRHLRRSLRGALRSSPLGDAVKWVRDWEDLAISLVRGRA